MLDEFFMFYLPKCLFEVYEMKKISRSLILQILQAAKIMRRFFYEAPAEIMRNYTTLLNNEFLS